ncbi:odorant receptor 47a-like isoform X3 [Ooceraea biroi]|uniref:odorant receptor 47a-like isoform X3 n=1 Tax=Ooceraea biroi TaxID=2015173 RepID=UPI000F086925|nr:odorant receptor 47a-like isoform X3 [Ooceraea biroi]
MDFIEQYYKLNRILLLCLGLWPYQNSAFKKIQIIFYQTLFVSFLVCQFNTFLVKKCNIDVLLKIFTYIVFDCIYIVKYSAWLLLSNNIKYIFDRMRHDWNILKDQTECEILREYADNARLHTIFFLCKILLLATLCFLGLLTLGCVPRILDIIMPLNESRPRQLPIIVEYFIDEETYFYAILIHIATAIYAGSVTLAACATMLISYILHVCAMFKIASYRIKHICDKDVLNMPKDIKQYILYERLIHAIYVHRRAMDLCRILTNSFTIFYFVLLGFGMLSMSLSFFHLLHVIISLNDPVDLLMFLCIVFIHLYYIFMTNYFGQNVTDTSINVSETTYNTPWYALPLWMQKLICIMMQRSNKKTSLTVGGLFEASLEGFATVRNTMLRKNCILMRIIKKILIAAHEYVHVLRYGATFHTIETTGRIVMFIKLVL